MIRFIFFLRKYFFDLAFYFQSLPIFPIYVRSYFWRLLGLKVLGRCYLNSGIVLVGSHFKDSIFELGKGCVIGSGCYIDYSGAIFIGEKVHVGPMTAILSVTHTIQNSVIRRDAMEMVRMRTIIERGCWIGTGARILPGVRIGEGCVVGSGAVVVRDCLPNGLYVGAPARRIRDLPLESLH